MTKIFYGLLGGLCLSINIAVAEAEATLDCRDVRLDSPGQAFAKIPAYDQMRFETEDPAICYAIVASELRDANRFSQGDKLDHLSSPISLLLNHKTNLKSMSATDLARYGSLLEKDGIIGKGSTMAAIAASNTQPVCDQNWLEKFASLSITSKEIIDVGTTRFLKELLNQVADYALALQLKSNVEEKEFPVTPYFKCRIGNQATNIHDLIEASKAALANVPDPLPTARTFLASLCAQHSFSSQTPEPQSSTGYPDWQELGRIGSQLKLKNLTAQERAALQARYNELAAPDFRTKKLKATLNHMLNLSAPVAISYCHEYLKNPQPCAPTHISVVIGSHMTSRGCEYLVRDSYGKECPSRLKCEKNGSVWVPEDDLLATLERLTWIPPAR